MARQTKVRRLRQGLAAMLDKFPADWQEPSRTAFIEAVILIAFPENSSTELQHMTGVLADVLQLDIDLNGGRLAALAKNVLAAGYNADAIARAYSLEDKTSPWCSDWRSKKGTEPPSERDLNVTLAKFTRQMWQRSQPVDMDKL